MWTKSMFAYYAHDLAIAIYEGIPWVSGYIMKTLFVKPSVHVIMQ